MMQRKLKDKLKEIFFLAYRFGTTIGIHILPVHYYSSEPDIIELEKTMGKWAKPSALPGIEADLDKQIQSLKQVCNDFQNEYLGNKTYYEAVKEHAGPGFGYIEAQVLHAVIRYYKPSRIVEVGSGVSTYCSHEAAKMNALEGGKPCEIICIEPYPSRFLRDLSLKEENIRLFSRPVQDIPLELFENLAVNDLLFIDSSHVVKAGSDVNHIILEILPRLSRGVIIHFHDIYFPYDYQRNALQTFFHSNETSLLRAFLMFNPKFSILFCLSHLHYERTSGLKDVFAEYEPQSGWNGLNNRDYDPRKHFPSSTWIQVCQ